MKASAYYPASPFRIIVTILAAVALRSLAFVLGAAEREAASLALLLEEKVARTLQVVDLTLVDVSGDIQRHASFLG